MKEPWLAVFLTKIFPGVGHIYAGRKTKGIVLISLYTFLYLIFSYFLFNVIYGDTANEALPLLVIAALCFPTGLVLVVYALFNSHKTARLFNDRNKLVLPPAKKKPWLAVFLSAILPGIGQFYNGSIARGILCILLLLVLLVAQGLHYLFSFLFIPLYLFAVKDAFETGERINGTNRNLMDQGRISAKVLVVTMIVIGAIPLSPVIRTHYMQAFKMPSGSMQPTLQIGDHILIDKTDAARSGVKKGDIIVFEYPVDPSRHFIKRVIAVGGDVIEGSNKDIYVNGTKLDEAYIQHSDVNSRIPRRDNFEAMTVPANSFFVLGDNRDASFDSRFWGFVSQDQIKGKAFKIYWSWNKEKMSVRWERIGMRIE